MLVAALLACHVSTAGQAAEADTGAGQVTGQVSVVEPPPGSVEPGPDSASGAHGSCHHPRYVTRKGAKVLLLLVETPGLFALVPSKKDGIEPVVYSTGELGYAPEMTPVLPGEIARVYQCNGHAWAYLGDLNLSGFDNQGGRVTYLTTPKMGGGTNQVPWVAEGPLIKPKRE